MRSWLLCLVLVSISKDFCCGQNSDQNDDDEYPDAGKELRLTPLIRSGRLRQAKQLARVVGIGDIISYSGYLTVNAPHCKSNLFFWFFPAINDMKTAPMIFSQGGGPGSSALNGLFTEHGPFYVPAKGARSLRFRNTTWALTHSVIYIDSPVGAGFSYTEDDSCYCESTDEAAKDIYDALIQFFTLFPEFRKNDFFVSSGSYGGKFVPAIGFKIHLENQLLSASKQHQRINLKGLIIASGFTDPINQIDYGDFYYSVGIISEDEWKYFKQQEELTKSFIKSQQWEAAFNTCEPLIIGCCYPNSSLSYFENVTGFTNSLNLLFADKPESMSYHIAFLNSKLMRDSLHTGNNTFDNTNSYLYEKFKKDIYQSLRYVVEELLNADYNFLIYSGQLDLIVPHTTVSNYVHKLSWKNRDAFHKSKRKIWRSKNGEVAGYAQSTQGLTHMLVRNAGHKISFDQPQSIFEVITNFTRYNLF